MKKYILALTITPLILFSCKKKSFLTRTPKIELTTQSALKSYDNFKTYAWNLYDYYAGYGFIPGFLTSQECNSDNMAETISGNQSAYMNHTKIVPGTGKLTHYLEISGWDFSYIREVNVMLDAIDNSEMSQTDKEHWRSVGYFFRALRYYDLVAAFGSVPWIEHALNEDSTKVLYASRTPRNIVTKKMLKNLEWADAHIGEGSPDGKNTINEACIKALISRFGLFEGTWRKYHDLDSAKFYLEASKTYSEKVMQKYTECMPSYDAVYNSKDLSGKPGIILFKQYAPNIVNHEFGPRIMGSTAEHLDLTQDAVNSYLCTDGKPISTSAVYEGGKNIYKEFAHRDHRLYFTVVPPYKVELGTPSSTWSYVSNPMYGKYIHLMDSLKEGYPLTKQLPFYQWSPSMATGSVISQFPHFYSYNYNQPQAISQLGYFYWKQYNRFPLDNSPAYSSTDYPIFRIGEIWLNYAEVMAELGLFNQQVADETLNKLRPRAGLPSIDVSQINSGFDPNRDPSVSPILWEIRRARRVELLGDGFRFNDLKRWAKGKYMEKMQLGVYVDNAEYDNELSIENNDSKGHVVFFPKPEGWLDKYYLEPIPTQELELNDNLKQNPGW